MLLKAFQYPIVPMGLRGSSSLFWVTLVTHGSCVLSSLVDRRTFSSFLLPYNRLVLQLPLSSRGSRGFCCVLPLLWLPGPCHYLLFNYISNPWFFMVFIVFKISSYVSFPWRLGTTIVSLLLLKVPSVPCWFGGPWGFVITFYLTTLVPRRSSLSCCSCGFQDPFAMGIVVWLSKTSVSSFVARILRGSCCTLPLLWLPGPRHYFLLATSVICGCPFTIVVCGSFLHVLLFVMSAMPWVSSLYPRNDYQGCQLFFCVLTIAGLFFYLVATIQGLFFIHVATIVCWLFWLFFLNLRSMRPQFL